MVMDKDDLLKVKPLENYDAPEMPTLAEDNLDSLKELPSRWAKKAIFGTTGILLVTGAIHALQPPTQPPTQPHFGGAGGAPIYVAHFTELDALNIIKTRLAEVGINFSDEIPNYEIPQWIGATVKMGVDFFDAENKVAINFYNPFRDEMSSLVHGLRGSQQWRTDRMVEDFTELDTDTIFGVFYNPSIWRDWEYRNRYYPHSEHETAYLTERLERQIQNFIDQLRENGIID